MRKPGPLPLASWRSAQRVAWVRLTCAVLLPFLCAAVVRSMYFSANSTSAHPVQQRQASGALEADAGLQPACDGQLCGDPEAMLEAARAAAAAAAAMAGPDRRRPVIAPATSSLTAGAPAPAQRPRIFLFIGILSGRGYRHRRMAVRGAWASKAQVEGQVVTKFVLSEDERTPQVEEEVERYGDIIFVREKTDYKSILYKTFYVLEYAAMHYDAAFVLKTDDDAFVNVGPLMQQLRAVCEDPECRGERIYMGRVAHRSEVVLQPGHRWNNADFYIHTGLRLYPNYMMGGGYVIGGEVARVLVDMHARTPLRFTTIEDATVGFWLAPLEVRHIDHPKFYTWAEPCCFNTSRLRDASGSRFRLLDSFEEDICSTDPFLVLHKIESPAKMRFMGQRVANCTAPEPWVLAKSIEKYVAPETRENWDEQREAVLAARPSSSKGKGGKGKAAAAAAAAGGEEEEDEGAALQKAAAAAVASQPEEDEEDEGSRDEHAQTALDDDGHR